MAAKVSCLLLIVLWLALAKASAENLPIAPAGSPQVMAESAILCDAATGQILFEKDSHTRRPVASTTKIMTAILVLENCAMDDIVVASKAASEVPFTSLHLKPGEEVRVKDLLSALLIRSANDAAYAFAEHIGGTVPGFARKMNQKAREIGALDTHFVNPNGLYDPNHYSSAYDLALMARYALRFPTFNQIVCTPSKIIDRSTNKEDLLVQSHSTFLRTYEGADGVKSGYTKQSGKCYVGSATRDGWRLLSVVLKSTDSQSDTVTLMDYGFATFRKLVLAAAGSSVAKVAVAGGRSEVDAVPERDLAVAVRQDASDVTRLERHLDQVQAPLKKGDKLGTLTAFVGDKAVVTVDLKAAQDVGQTTMSMAWPWVRSIGLLGIISIGIACGRAAAKSTGNGRRRLA